MTDYKNPSAEEFSKAYYAFRTENDKRTSEIATKGAADPLTETNVRRLSDEVTRLSNAAHDNNRRLDRFETALGRSPLGAIKSDDHAEAASFSLERRHYLRSDVEVGAYREYKSAFRNYLRRNNVGSSLEEVKALSVGSDPDGGFAVTPDMTGRIVSLIRETSPMRQVASVSVIGTDALEGVNDLNEATSGWVGETESRSETAAPKIGEWRIPVYEQYAEPRVTQKLLDDAMFNAEEFLANKIAERLSRMENTAFINGNGVKQPRGILTYAAGTPSSTAFNAIEQLPTGGAGTFAATNPGDVLINLVYSLKANYRERAVFMMRRSTLAEVRKLKDGQGNYLWQPDFQQRQGGTLLGFNVIEAEDMPAIAANSLSIAFGDFSSAYQIVDRQGIRVLRDAFTAKPYVKFYTTKRVGGDVVNFDALKLMKFAVS